MIRYCLIALMLCLSGCDEPKDAVPLAPAPPVEVPDVAEVPAAVTSPDAPVPASAPVGVPVQPESAPLPTPGVSVKRSQAPSFPNIPAPAPETLNYVPSVQTFAEPVNDCPDPSQPWAGWEDGVGGVLPPCWTREQQNAYMRSH